MAQLELEQHSSGDRSLVDKPSKLNAAGWVPTSPDAVITADRSEGDAVVVSQQITLLWDVHDAVPHVLRAVSTVAVASTVAKCKPLTVELSDAENGRFGGSMSLTTGAANGK